MRLKLKCAFEILCSQLLKENAYKPKIWENAYKPNLSCLRIIWSKQICIIHHHGPISPKLGMMTAKNDALYCIR